MLKTKVKASQVTNLTDARYFSAWDVEFLGFDLEENSETYIDPTKVAAMIEWLEGPKMIGEFGSFPDLEKMNLYKEQLNLFGVQVGSFCEPELIKKIKEKDIYIIKEIVVSEETDWDDVYSEFDLLENFVDCFLLDFSRNKIDVENNLEIKNHLEKLCRIHDTFIDGILSPEYLDDFLEKIDPYGLAMKGGEEEKIGYKSFDEMDDIFEALEIFV